MDFHNFSCKTSHENAKVTGVKFFATRSLCCYHGIPCKSLRHKSNTFHTNISTSHMFPSITFTETSIDETYKTQQKVRCSKFMLTMSTIHANTCIQMTTPLRNRWWFWWQCPVLVLRSYTSWNQGCQWWLLPQYSSAEYASAGYPLCFWRLLPFSARWGNGTSCTWHCHHAAETTPEFIPPKMWPPNLPGFNLVDYSI